MDDPLQPSDPARVSVRASDMDRERVADVLRDSYADGRLTLEEMQERLDQAYAGKTFLAYPGWRPDPGPRSPGPAALSSLGERPPGAPPVTPGGSR